MFLLGTTTMFAQSTTVRGVTLNYNKVKKTMTLNISPKIMYTNDSDLDVKIEINKGFAVKMVMNDVNYSMSEPYFQHTGHVRDMGWIFTTHKLSTCKEVKENYIYVFYDVEVDEEYILTVSDVCDNKFVTNEQTSSITINK